MIQTTPIATIEAARLEYIRSMSILDTPREPAFDRLVFVAAQRFRVPMAFITLLDEHRLWYKAAVGTDRREVPRSVAFCAYTVMSNEPMVVEDTTHDERFFDHPFVVGSPFIRFYAGAPLLGPDGLNIGSVCITDRRPHAMTAVDLGVLRSLAQTAMRLIRMSSVTAPAVTH